VYGCFELDLWVKSVVINRPINYQRKGRGNEKVDNKKGI